VFQPQSNKKKKERGKGKRRKKEEKGGKRKRRKEEKRRERNDKIFISLFLISKSSRQATRGWRTNIAAA
jgi:hypothetical protein